MSVAPDEPETPQYDNPESAERLRDELAQREAESEEQTAEHLSIKDRLQRKRESDTITEEVLGEPIEFRKPGAYHKKRAMVLSKEFQGVDQDDLDAAAAAELVDLMVDTLAELSVDDELDEEEWGKFAFDDIESAFGTLMNDGEDVDPEVQGN